MSDSTTSRDAALQFHAQRLSTVIIPGEPTPTDVIRLADAMAHHVVDDHDPAANRSAVRDQLLELATASAAARTEDEHATAREWRDERIDELWYDYRD